MREYENYPAWVVEKVVCLLEKGTPKNRIAIVGGVNGIPYQVIETQNSSYETWATNDMVVGWGDPPQDRSGNYNKQ